MAGGGPYPSVAPVDLVVGAPLAGETFLQQDRTHLAAVRQIDVHQRALVGCLVEAFGNDPDLLAGQQLLQPSPRDPRQPSLFLAFPCSQLGRIDPADIDNPLPQQAQFLAIAFYGVAINDGERGADHEHRQHAGASFIWIVK